MKEEKNRHTVWLTDEAWNEVKTHYQGDNCSTQNEYIETVDCTTVYNEETPANK